MASKVLSWYWEHSDKKGTELLLLLGLADVSNEDGYCYPGVPRLAKKARCTKRHAQRLLAKFEGEGIIGVVERGGIKTKSGSTNLYYLLEYRSKVLGDDTIPKLVRDRKPAEDKRIHPGSNQSDDTGVTPSDDTGVTTQNSEGVTRESPHGVTRESPKLTTEHNNHPNRTITDSSTESTDSDRDGWTSWLASEGGKFDIHRKVHPDEIDDTDGWRVEAIKNALVHAMGYVAEIDEKTDAYATGFARRWYKGGHTPNEVIDFVNHVYGVMDGEPFGIGLLPHRYLEWRREYEVKARLDNTGDVEVILESLRQKGFKQTYYVSTPKPSYERDNS